VQGIYGATRRSVKGSARTPWKFGTLQRPGLAAPVPEMYTSGALGGRFQGSQDLAVASLRTAALRQPDGGGTKQ